ncbi:CDP-alcohol phosphatidyltransferase family protein [Phototrophicus methaneseepsis]|uniref:CDP-alcohol phosphatidyltransferase family protein n=1 Tax=Phototrophicus methaneseepsis TaxID=2710758 RepID=A0A7S8IGL3_9CHLR|nr:CDP-alcohol phosphatidyltransferase family protein [Phototrophicus methaneseepsis]QPC84916.1 CDP-alcohol phosphatidyltransferase family protein [Phototrophicus methaneseepsis]
MTEETPQEKPVVLTDRVRRLTRDILDPTGRFLHRLGIHPDTITIAGLVMVAIASVFIAQGEFIAGGIILLLGLPFDALDGAVARAMQRTDKFGAVLDSVLDRYADGFIFAGLSYYFAVQDQFELMLLAVAALLGSLLVSYVRARADGVHVETKIGLFTRLERIVVILIMLLIPGLLTIGLVILAVGTNITALQRLWFVYKTLKNRGG